MAQSYFQFFTPQALWLLMALPLVFFFEMRKLRLLRLPLSSTGIIGTKRITPRALMEFVPPLIKTTAMALVIVALARPQIANELSEITSAGVDIVLALDTSGSMKALDMRLKGEQTDRMAAVKTVVGEFIMGRQYDRIGMVVFGKDAYTQCPLTLDYDILSGYLDLIEVGIAGDATAIGNALATSVKRLAGSIAKSKIIVLLTDGANTAGEVAPQASAELARDKGIKIYTIGVGSKAVAVPFPVETPFGIQIRNVELPMDEALLDAIAKTTGGQYFRADSTESLRAIYSKIDELEKTEVEMERFTEYRELYVDWLTPALALLVTGWVLRHTYFLRIP